MPRKNDESIAVIGGGIAGALTSELLSKKGYRVTLFEKSNSLGGCSGSFIKDGFSFNTAATTIAGLKEDFPVYRILQSLDAVESIKIIEPSIFVHTPGGIIRRFSTFKETVDEIQRVFPEKANYDFWKKVYETTHEVLRHDYYHNFSSIKGSIKTVSKMGKLLFKYFKPFVIPAKRGLKYYFPTINKDYYDFMDAHVKIVAQSSIDKVNFLTLMLSLGYPFTVVGYPEGGMGRLFNELIKSPICLLNAEVRSLERVEDGFVIRWNSGEERFPKVILAMPIFENMQIIKDNPLKGYLQKYLPMQTDNSAVVVYGVIRDFHPEGSFHLKILKQPLPYTSSKYLFFSFQNSKRENYSYTIFSVSTHTKASSWINLQRQLYDMKKNLLTHMILREIIETFGLTYSQIVKYFMATPETFFRYLGRRSVGGIPVTRKNPFWKIPSNFTPFEDVFLAGDSFFCYQGWIGVSMGIRNLVEHFNEKF